MNALEMGRWAVLKVDTTGKKIGVDHVVDVAVVQFDGTTFVGEGRAVVNPQVPIHPKASAIHGITNERVATRPLLTQVADRLAARIATRTIVGYNVAKFDVPMLTKDLEQSGMERLAGVIRAVPVVDVLLLARHLEPAFHSYGFEAVASRAGVELPKKDGRALSHAHGIWSVLMALARKQPAVFDVRDSDFIEYAQSLLLPSRAGRTVERGYDV